MNVLGGPLPLIGGTVSILRTDVANQVARTFTIIFDADVGLIALMDLRPGRYAVTHSPPRGYALSEGETGQRSVQVFENGYTEATFVATPLAR